MRLSKIKTKEIRYVVWKYRLKRFLPHILTLFLAVIVAGGAFSAYSVYHKKHQKQLAKQSEVQREKDVNTARKKAQKEKTSKTTKGNNSEFKKLKLEVKTLEDLD